MKPTEIEPKFAVCPKCGGDTIKKEGKWVCKNCDYEEKIE